MCNHRCWCLGWVAGGCRCWRWEWSPLACGGWRRRRHKRGPLLRVWTALCLHPLLLLLLHPLLLVPLLLAMPLAARGTGHRLRARVRIRPWGHLCCTW